jgi:hypothetical protein
MYIREESGESRRVLEETCMSWREVDGVGTDGEVGEGEGGGEGEEGSQKCARSFGSLRGFSMGKLQGVTKDIQCGWLGEVRSWYMHVVEESYCYCIR